MPSTRRQRGRTTHAVAMGMAMAVTMPMAVGMAVAHAVPLSLSRRGCEAGDVVTAAARSGS